MNNQDPKNILSFQQLKLNDSESAVLFFFGSTLEN